MIIVSSSSNIVFYNWHIIIVNIIIIIISTDSTRVDTKINGHEDKRFSEICIFSLNKQKYNSPNNQEIS